jgi:hypothetical protein
MNFTDFPRYLVWFEPPDELGRDPGSLVTSHAEDLYPMRAGGSS